MVVIFFFFFFTIIDQKNYLVEYKIVFEFPNCLLLFMGTSEKSPFMKESLEKLRVLLSTQYSSLVVELVLGPQ